MGGFFDELGRRLAERWISLLVLPGALYIAAATVAHALGQAHALGVADLSEQIKLWARSPIAASVGGQIVVLAASLTAAASAGLAAQALGSAVERLMLAASWNGWIRPLRNL